MPLIEIEQDALAQLQAELKGARPYKEVLTKLQGSAKTRLPTLRLMKEAYPELVVPEIDAAAPLNAEIAQEREARLALEKRLDDEKAEREKSAREAGYASQIERERERLRQAGYSTEGIKKIEDLMEKENLIHYEAAEALFEKQQPKEDALIPSGYGRNWDLFEPPAEDNDIRAALSPDHAKRGRALQRWTGKAITQALQDVRGTAPRVRL